jgi:spore coat protein U-like protein
VTAARSLLIAMVAAALLIGVRPIAGVEQFPRGLLSGESRAQVCVIETRPVTFGVYDPLAGTAVDAIGQVIYSCGNLLGAGTRAGSKNVRIELETGSSNQYVDRRMTSGADYLLYNLYLDATHRTVWGNGTNNTGVYVDSHPPNLTPVTVTVFGRIRGLQDVSAGQYVDAMLARVVF